MKKIPQEIIRILSSVFLSELTEQDRQRLEEWLAEDIHNRQIYAYLQDTNRRSGDLRIIDQFKLEEAWKKQSDRLHQHTGKRIIHWKLWVPAVAAILIAIIGVLYITVNTATFQDMPIAEIQPGGNQATIVLPEGQTVVLNEDAAGIVIDSVLRYENGDIMDDAGSDWRSFTVHTPKGGQYRMVLPDGSKVWLNTASELQYQEDASARSVTLIGEAYFEIEKKAYQDVAGVWRDKPFNVYAGHQQIHVTGTHFNVKAYPEDIFTQTTLLEGSVFVETKDQRLQLKPGEQAASDGDWMIKKEIDVSIAVAWKDGNFMFAEKHLEEILKQVGRWYNVDFKLENESLKTERFEAMLPRFSQLNELLNLLEKTDKVKFKYKGRTIYVLKK